MSKIKEYQDLYQRARFVQRLAVKYRADGRLPPLTNVLAEGQDEFEKQYDDEAKRVYDSMTPEEQQEAMLWKLAQG